MNTQKQEYLKGFGDYTRTFGDMSMRFHSDILGVIREQAKGGDDLYIHPGWYQGRIDACLVYLDLDPKMGVLREKCCINCRRRIYALDDNEGRCWPCNLLFQHQSLEHDKSL